MPARGGLSASQLWSRMGPPAKLRNRNLASLPDELLLHIMGKLPAAGLACLSATSKRFGLEDGEAGCSLSESAALLRIRNECVRDASAYESLRGCESFKRLLRTLELPVRILPTGLTPEELERVESIVPVVSSAGCDVQIVRSADSPATHIVTKGSDDANVCQTRTVKVFQGISHGAWMVSLSWVQECWQAGRIVNEEPHELGLRMPPALTGLDMRSKDVDNPNVLLGNVRSRLRCSRGLAPLFKGMRFLLVGDFPAPRVGRDDVVRFIELNGGSVLDRDGLGWRSVRGQLPPPRRNHKDVWLVAAYTIAAKEVNQLAKNWGMRPLTVSWILDSLSAYEVCPPEVYRIPDHGCEDESTEEEEAHDDVDEHTMERCKCRRCQLRSHGCVE